MAPERRWHLTTAELTPALLDELGRELPHAIHRVLRPGLIESELRDHDSLLPLRLAFAAQTLPDVRRIQATSIKAWARTVFDAMAPALASHRGPWRLHALAIGEAPAGRVRLIEQALVEHTKEQLRRLERARVTDLMRPWQPDEALVQVAFTSGEEGVLSVALPAQRRRLERALSRFPAGRVEVPRDARPPSRAYRKLLEAEVHLGHAIAASETCVDLGASPGGWTYIALDRGAQVTAIDRSELRDDLMSNPRLTFVRGDAFTFVPKAPVDWLVCDLIAFPERSVELLDTWLSRRLCRRFVVTLKFRGDADLAQVEAAKKVLDRYATHHRLLHLGANKNEVTALGEVAAPPKAILFDLDGVLVRSKDAWAHLLGLAGEHFRGRAVTRDEFDPTFGQSTADDVKSFGFACTPEALDAFYLTRFADFARHLWVDPDALALLTSLRDRGLALGVVTNCPGDLARRILEHAGLLPFFGTLACADPGHQAKPAPDLVELALSELGTQADEAWMVGDSRFDRSAAAAAGVRFVGLGLEGDLRLERLADLSAVLR